MRQSRETSNGGKWPTERNDSDQARVKDIPQEAGLDTWKGLYLGDVFRVPYSVFKSQMSDLPFTIKCFRGKKA